MNIETKNFLRNSAAHLCAVGVAAYFLAAAFPKIDDPRQFALDIKNYQVLPEQFLNLAAIYLPWLEAVAAVALVIPRTRRAGAILIAGQLLLFIAAVSYAAFYKGLDISCGCTGKDSAKAGWATIRLDSVLLFGTILATFLTTRKRPAGNFPDTALSGAVK